MLKFPLYMLFLFSVSVFGLGDKEIGIPFINTFKPNETGGDLQTWAFVQDERGIIYAGNQPGVLEFDGASWRMIKTANNTFVRSLAIDKKGRIFVGTHSDFGYLESDINGTLNYVSLLGYLDEAFHSFGYTWTTLIVDDAVFFQALEGIFRFKEKADGGWEIKTWLPETRFNYAFSFGNTYFIMQGGIGLMKMEADSLLLLPGGEQFADDRLQVMLPVEQGKEDPEHFIAGTFNRGLFEFREGAFKPFPTEADVFLKDNTLYSSAILSDGTFALATIVGGIVILDDTGKNPRYFSTENGVFNNSVLSIFVDRNNGLWAAPEGAIHIIDTPSPLSRFTASEGVEGSIYKLIRHKGILYVATTIGVFYLDDNAGKIMPIPGLLPGNTQSFDLLEFDDQLLAAIGSGLYKIENKQAIVLKQTVGTEFSPNVLLRSKMDKNILYAGGFDGLYRLRYKAKTKQWSYEGKISNVTEYISTMTEIEPGIIWGGTNASGLLKMDFTQSADEPVITRYSEEAGLPPGGAVVRTIYGKILAHTDKGFYRINKATKFVLDSSLMVVELGRAPINYHGISEDFNKNIWINMGRETALLKLQEDGSYQIEKTLFQKFADLPVQIIYPEKDGTVWFGTTESLLKFDPSVTKDYQSNFKTLIRKVTVNDDSLVYGGSYSLGSEVKELLSSENSLHFEFSAPTYENPSQTRYQSFLEGFDDHWSDWTKDNSRYYTNLAPGEYIFKVKSKNIYQNIGEEAQYSLRIFAPWYATLWAYFTYAIFIALIIYFIVHWRTRQLNRQAEVLEETVKERTIEIQQRMEDLAVINSVQEALVREMDINSIYQLVGGKVRDVFDSQIVIISIFDHEKELDVQVFSIERGVVTQGATRPIDKVRRNIIEKRETLLINRDLMGQVQNVFGIEAKPIPGTELPKSALFVPLMVGDLVKGYISLQDIDKENAFTDSDVSLLSTLANGMSVAMENARLFDETKRLLKETEQRNTELEVINSVQDNLVREMDPGSIYNLVGDRLCALVPETQILVIRTFDHEKNEEHWEYVIEKGERIYADPGPIMWANKQLIKSGESLIINKDYLQTAKKYGGKGVSFGNPPKSAVFVPMILGSVVKGSISLQNVDRENVFNESDIRLLKTLANSMIVALENARLFEQTRQLLKNAEQLAAELATVNSVSTALVSQLKFDALVKLVGDKIQETFNADIVYVALLDDKRETIEFPYEYGDKLEPLPMGEGLTSKVIMSGEPLLINKDLKERQKLLGIGIIGIPAASYLGVPIPVDGEFIGVISIQSTKDENLYGEKETRLLNTIAANVGVALSNARSYRKLNETLENLKSTQDQLIVQEKLASLGQLTAGIAHEIKNPLNFINNFAQLLGKFSRELIDDLSAINSDQTKKIQDNLGKIIQLGEKINEHGKRADSIVHNMMNHARTGTAEFVETDLNLLLDEAANLVYHGMRAKQPGFNIKIEKEFDPDIKPINIISQDVSRVFLNIIGNGCYAADKRAKKIESNGHSAEKFNPTIFLKTLNFKDRVEVYIKDNGTGIPQDVQDKIFTPFFTTKPTGEGTGLGLSMSYDTIVKSHSGQLSVESFENDHTEFRIVLPRNQKQDV